MTFRDQPIRRKLITVILITSGVVLTMTCGTFLTYELVTFRQDMVRRLSMLGQVVAANSTASLAFENPTDGVQVLSALSADPHIVAAALYDEGGALFATYPEHAPVAFPARPDPDGHRFGAARLVLSSPVAMADRRLGTLYLESDLAGLYDRARLCCGRDAIPAIGFEAIPNARRLAGAAGSRCDRTASAYAARR